MSIIDVISHALSEHVTRAAREGRGVEQNFAALIREIVMTTVSELQGKVNSLGDKMSQLEADVKDLVSKQGGTAGGPAGSGPVVTQDQVDSMGAAVDNVAARIDALKDEVVNGSSTPPVTPPPSDPNAPPVVSGSTTVTPSTTTPPAAVAPAALDPTTAPGTIGTPPTAAPGTAPAPGS